VCTSTDPPSLSKRGRHLAQLRVTWPQATPFNISTADAAFNIFKASKFAAIGAKETFQIKSALRTPNSRPYTELLQIRTTRPRNRRSLRLYLLGVSRFTGQLCRRRGLRGSLNYSIRAQHRTL
jgi:hypothetical protein